MNFWMGSVRGKLSNHNFSTPIKKVVPREIPYHVIIF